MKYSEISLTKAIIGWILPIFIVLGGCATSNIQKEQEKSIGIASSGKIAVVPLGNRADDLAECVQKKIHRTCPDLQFFNSEQFVDMLYPWFEPGTAPESKEDLEALFNNRLVQERINSLGIRYVVNIRGGTLKYNYTDDSFEIPGLFGFMDKSHEERTDIFVSVCDLKKAKMLLKTESHAHDTEYLFIFPLLPIWIAARTEAPICDEIFKKLLPQLPECNSRVDE